MNKYAIPRYLDEPYKIAIFTLDEVVLICVPTIVSLYMTSGPMIGLLIGVVFVSILKKIKGGEGHNQMLRIAYWYLPPIIRFKSTPPSYVREILG